ncbi:kelch-like 11 (Drosophila) (predicted) [Rattus norvegicus]|uniref:Kelch-like protein 11 n=2 Tax=Rattus norvegicus TaxID=10116 RepID=D3ZPJ1_RAT|nr:kelch-like protein 11 [Rattus norvegicus]XP_032770460.1 kelch-like protein 11 [Rattus rattus]EDM06041.1 kelch-like 11 (Drosophila) (predicted) [Rattus norvegicus]|eukprot:NP_001099308.1 kelch-like protein 11 [Rattus norvegicus]
MAAAVAAAAAAAAAAASFQVLEMESMETAVAGSASLAAEVRGSGTVDFVTGAGISTLVDTGGGDPGPEAEDFECSTHCSELSWRQNEQRRQGLFCDITLCFGGAGGREFRAHRSVLAAATEYFTPLLSGQFSESRSGRVEMRKWSSEPGPEPDTVEAVIEYMYTGRIRVSTGSVHEVLELADRFLLIRLKEFCGEFLKKKLHLSNCVAIHSLAHMYTLSQLALKAADMIRRNFYKVIQDEEFYTLPFHLIRDWLSDLEITVDSEEVLFETVLKWVQRNAEERERYFEELFKLLRLSQMKPTYLTRHVKPERLVANNEVCVKLVAEAVERHALRAENIQSGTLQHPTSQVSLLPRYGQNMDVIMVIGGVSEGGDYLSECVGYFVDEDRWVNLPHIHNHLDGHAVAITESYVYVAGSMEPGFAKTVERYNPNLNTWEHVCSLMTRKHSFGLTEVKGKLYSIGGHGNFSPGFKDVTVYNPELDKWHNLESAPKILRDVKALAVEDRFVYIAARTPVDRDTEDGLKAVITCYDTETRQWQDVESLPLIDNYCFFQMSVVNSNFYQTASCCPKSYSLENEEAVRKIAGQVSDEILESLPPEVLSIEGAAICYYRDDVFIIGGWKNSDDIDKQYRKEAYRYCAERKRWMLLPPMPQPRCRATACHVRIPYRYLHGTQRYPMPQNLMWQKDRIRQMQEIHRHALNMRRVPSSQIEC